MNPREQQDLKEKISQYCFEHHICGILRVTIAGNVVFEQCVGFADIKTKTPFHKGSMFTLYSLSKPFCAIGLLLLAEKGLVDLDTHPAQYVPEAMGFDERVTVRHLLHHTSGLPDFEQDPDFSRRYAPGYSHKIRKHLKLLSKYPSHFEPGTDGKYENINFILCALIIENVSGMDYADYMKKAVFMPLGMKTAVVDHEQLVIPNRVTGYELKNGKLAAVAKSHSWMFGAGDIVGTVDDVYCLNNAIKNRLLLREKTWQDILTPSPINKMGMGCTVTVWHGRKRITHNGGHIGFRTLHIQLPEEDFDLIFLSNSGFGNARNDLSEIVYAAFCEENDFVSEIVEMDKGYVQQHFQGEGSL